VNAVELLTNVEAVTLLGTLHVRGCDVWVEPVDGCDRLWVAPADRAHVSPEECARIAQHRDTLMALVCWMAEGGADPCR